MKCVICNKETSNTCYSRTGENPICKDCCKKRKSWAHCNTNCSNFDKEISSISYQGDVELTRVFDGVTHKFAKNLFLPNIYDNYYCNIQKLDINVYDINHVYINLEFTIHEKRRSFNEEYVKDSWKLKEMGREETDLYPLFQVYRGADFSSSIVDGSFIIDDYPYYKLEKHSDYYFTYLPFSKILKKNINVKDRPEFKEDFVFGNVSSGKWFSGTNDTYFGKIQLEKKYCLKLNLFFSKLKVQDNNSVNIPFGLFLPFSHTNVENYSINLFDSTVPQKDSFQYLMVPLDTDREMIFATPLEQKNETIGCKGFVKYSILESEKSFHYDRFSIFYHVFNVLIKVELSVKAKISDFPILLFAYNNQMKVHKELFAPLKIDLSNTGDIIRKLHITCKIEGLSKIYTKYLFINPKESITKYIYPVLNWDIASEISETTVYSIEISVRNNSNLIFLENYEVSVLPVNTFVSYLENEGKSQKTYLYQFITGFITPHDKIINRILEKSSNCANQIIGNVSGNKNKLNEMEAIYNHLSKSLNYVSRSFDFQHVENALNQKIYLPRDTINHASGNCIDFVVLFASIFEVLKYEIVLILIKGHAFIGFEVDGLWYYLETTFVGRYDFKKALEKGYEKYDENFISQTQPKNKSSKIVSLKLARKTNILPLI